MVIKLAKETGWSYTRMQGGLVKLPQDCGNRVSANLPHAQHGLDTGPKCGESRWDQLLKQHAKTLWACDFFTKNVWTTRGLVQMYLLVFIQIGSQWVWVSRAMANPHARSWSSSPGTCAVQFQERDEKPNYLIHDRDTKFTKHFRAERLKPVKLPPKSPNLNAYAERWIESIKHEALDHFVVFGENHLNHVVSDYVAQFHTERAHQALGNRPPLKQDLPDEGEPIDTSQIVCRERFGGLLKHYERRAA